MIDKSDFAQTAPVLIDLMREMRAHGDFTYGDLAENLAKKLSIPLLAAQRSVLQFCGLSDLQTDARVIEETPPTIAESIALIKQRAAAISKPQRPWPLHNTTGVDVKTFEKFRPAPSAKKWLIKAPDYVIACYHKADDPHPFTVAFGGTAWTPEYAKRNWLAGLDPRITPCLRMSANPHDPSGSAVWTHTLLSRRLGQKITWSDLPTGVKNHAIERGSRLAFGNNQ